jgi:hypothetical protein
VGAVTPVTPQTAMYEISRVSKDDEGSYSCVAQSSSGVTEERVQILVEEDSNTGVIPAPPPGPGRGSNHGIITTDNDRVRISVGGRAELRCYVRGTFVLMVPIRKHTILKYPCFKNYILMYLNLFYRQSRTYFLELG